MKLGKIFICINILVLSLLMLTGCTEKWPRIIYYRFDEYNMYQMVAIVETEDGYDLIAEYRRRKKNIEDYYAPSNIYAVAI